MENAKLRCKLSYFRHFDGCNVVKGTVFFYFLDSCDKLAYYYVEFVEHDKIYYSFTTNYYINAFPTLHVFSELIDTCKALHIELCVTDL